MDVPHCLDAEALGLSLGLLAVYSAFGQQIFVDGLTGLQVMPRRVLAIPTAILVFSNAALAIGSPCVLSPFTTRQEPRCARLLACMEPAGSYQQHTIP